MERYRGPRAGNYAWGDLDGIVNDAATANVKLLINIVKSPASITRTNGLPSDPKAMGNFVEAMMLRYGDKIGASRSGMSRTSQSRMAAVSPSTMLATMLIFWLNATTASRRSTRSTIVLAGAPSSTAFEREDVALPDENYYRAMYSYKDGLIKGHFDAQAVHPGGAANPPGTLFPDSPNTVANCPPELGLLDR